MKKAKTSQGVYMTQFIDLSAMAIGVVRSLCNLDRIRKAHEAATAVRVKSLLSVLGYIGRQRYLYR